MSRRTPIWLLGIVVALVGACSSGDDAAVDETEPGIVEAGPTDEPVAGATPKLEGTIVNKFDLDTSECFNLYNFLDQRTGTLEERSTTLDCGRPHDGEVFDTVVHPGDAETRFPGPVEMERWANAACFERFEQFVGLAYVSSTLEIGSVRPTETTWSDPVGRHREVICYVFAPDAQLSGSMAGSAL